MVSSQIIVETIKNHISSSKDVDGFCDKLLEYLKKNHLLHLLPNILRKLELENVKDLNKKTIHITTSHEFDKELVEKIKSFASREKGNTFKVSVDEDLIGGFVVKGNNKIMDASVKRNIQFLRESLTI